MISYKSAELFDERYARKPNRNGEDPLSSVDGRYDVAGYLDHQGEKFVSRFDANSYIVITKAMDTFDLGRGYASDGDALKRSKAREQAAERIEAAGFPSDYTEFQTSHGHDGFLAEMDAIATVVNGRFHAKRLLVVQKNTDG